MVLDKISVLGRHTNLDKVGQGPTALAVGAAGFLRLDFFPTFFSRLLFLSFFFLSLSGRRPDIN